MAEVLAVIAVVTEGAQMVDSVAKALKSTKDLFDSFEKTKDRSQEIIDAIVQAKNEIIARIDQKQFEDHRELLQANADFWFFDALPRLAQWPLNLETIADRQKLLVIDRQIDDRVQDLRIVTHYFNDHQSIDLPNNRAMMKLVILAHGLYVNMLALRTSVLLSDPASGGTPELFPDANIPNAVDNALNMVPKLCNGYQGERQRQVTFTPVYDHETRRVEGWRVKNDAGGDSCIPKFPEGLFTNNQNSIVSEAWKSSELGGQALPTLYQKWEGLKK